MTPARTISTHALREEGDKRMCEGESITVAISTHALREEGDLLSPPNVGMGPISTHALREEGDQAGLLNADTAQKISTHALREEGDKPPPSVTVLRLGFLPTPSARRATPRSPVWAPTAKIATRARRAEGDISSYIWDQKAAQFLPTPSARRATDSARRHFCAAQFLPTPSARRATRKYLRLLLHLHHFYPRPPRGGRPAALVGPDVHMGISTHALREEGDS